MTFESVDDRIDDYRDRLAPDDCEEFNRRLEEEIESLNPGEIRDQLISGYENSENHLELVLAAASAFDQDPSAGGYESGYEFAYTEPLEELNTMGEKGVTNGDVLLIKETDDGVYLCVIECKSGTGTERGWYTELEDIEEVFQTDRYRRILKSQLGVEDKPIRHEQYVLLGQVGQMISLNQETLDNDIGLPDNYAFWAYVKGELALHHMYGEVQEKSLAREVKNGVDAFVVENPIKYTYSDHPLTHLSVLVEDLIDEKTKDGDEHPFEFNRNEFHRMFNGNLQVGFEGEGRDRLVDEKVNHLLGLGLHIGIFINASDRVNSGRDYRILFQGQKSQVARQTSDEKYFDTMTEERRKERAFATVQEEFSPEQTRLWDWDSDDEEELEDGEEGNDSDNETDDYQE